MTPALSMLEIQAHFAEEWVLVQDPQADAAHEIRSGHVLCPTRRRGRHRGLANCFERTASMKAFWQRLHLWFWGKFFIFLVALGCGLRRRRMSHNNGVAGRGTLRIVDNPQFPASDFFEPGRVFPCRLRHACVAYWDDAMKAVRSGSLKFADSDFASPLDIQMNTGDYCFFWNARSFLEFAFSRHESGGIQYTRYYQKWADGRRSAASSIIRAPASYLQMYYHSHTPFGWKARDGKPRYVRFRLIPADRGPMSSAPDPAYIERARVDPAMADDVGNQRRLPEEKRDVNYLKREWRKRSQGQGRRSTSCRSSGTMCRRAMRRRSAIRSCPGTRRPIPTSTSPRFTSPRRSPTPTLPGWPTR